MDKPASSVAGVETGNVFAHPVRVYYEDTDAGGIVFYGNYLKFAERGRTELLRSMGIENSDISDRDGTVFVVRSCSIEYLRPAYLDDFLQVETEITEIGGASMMLNQNVTRDGERLTEMKVRMVCMGIAGNRKGKAVRIPADAREALERFSGLESVR
ncbi:MAG: tol-pal system-associated acyl-CoA thioesterase [Rhodospirillales bacterium]